MWRKISVFRAWKRFAAFWRARVDRSVCRSVLPRHAYTWRKLLSCVCCCGAKLRLDSNDQVGNRKKVLPLLWFFAAFSIPVEEEIERTPLKKRLTRPSGKRYVGRSKRRSLNQRPLQKESRRIFYQRKKQLTFYTMLCEANEKGGQTGSIYCRVGKPNYFLKTEGSIIHILHVPSSVFLGRNSFKCFRDSLLQERQGKKEARPTEAEKRPSCRLCLYKCLFYTSPWHYVRRAMMLSP